MFLLSSLLKWRRRQRELRLLTGRCRELEQELSLFFRQEVTLHPAAVKGGYDEIFQANCNNQCLAVVRVNSPHKQKKEPSEPTLPVCPLSGQARLDREWEAYQRLAPLCLAPEPLWRSHDAIACRWQPWPRVSNLLKKTPSTLWPLLERIIPAIGQMHAQGVTHLDLNTGNLLANNQAEGLMFIDFEYGPRPGLERDQQQAYDYLRLIDDCARPRRGGRAMVADLPRLVRLLQENIPPEVRRAPMGIINPKLDKLAGQRQLRQSLARLFPNLL